MYVPFELEMPGDLAGALGALAAGNGARTVPIAGGTNLIVDMRAKRERPDRVVGLGKVGELRGMDFGAERISIGGGTTVTDLLQSPAIAESAPSLVESSRLFAGLIDEAARASAAASSPVDDVRASAENRLHTVEALTRRLVAQAWDRLNRHGGSEPCPPNA